MIERKPMLIKKKKILIPIDGTERSLRSIDFVKGLFSKEHVEITVMNVKELVFLDGMMLSNELESSQKLGEEILNESEKELDGYEVNKYFTYGYAGDEIINKAKEDKIDIIVMTKSTKKGLNKMIGSVTIKVVKRVDCIVMIVPE